MRRAESDYSIIKEKEIFYGISLGYDYCSEHEWGIKKMNNKLGIDKSKGKLGIDNYTISKHDCIVFLKEENKAFLTSRKHWKKTENVTIKDLLPHDLEFAYNNSNLRTAWDEEDFCVIVSGEENVTFLEDLYEQFLKNNIAITRINRSIPAFSNASLSLLIVDRLPKEAIDEMYKSDKKQKDLVDYEAEIGMTKLKEDTRPASGYKKENYYMACSPKWIDYENAENLNKIKDLKKTKFDIQYWINYSDDDDNYGWYTVEEIREWLSTPGLKLKQIRHANR